MRIGVGTKNPAKIAAVGKWLDERKIQAEISSFNVPSGVPAMPMSDMETRQGAINRAEAVLSCDAEVSFGIGMEGGVSDLDGALYLCNWAAAADRGGRVISAAGARILLPEPLAMEVRAGSELGAVIDAYARRSHVSEHGGTIGILTAGRVSRTDMFVHILKLIEGIYIYQKNDGMSRI